MSILSVRAPDCFRIFQRSLIQSNDLPMADLLSDRLIAEVFEQERVNFGIADDDVFTPAITLWAMVSQFLFSGTGRSVKAAAGRVVSLYAQIDRRIVAQNAGNYCRAKAKIPVSALKKLTRSVACRAELHALDSDDLQNPLEPDQAEERLSPIVMAAIRSQAIVGRLINVDGFTIDAPDTPANQRKYPQNPAQAEGIGFPILRCVGLISAATGLLIDLASAPYSGKGSGETTLLRQLKKSLRCGDILVADSYYCIYWLICMCQSIGVEIVMKNHHKRDNDPLGANRISENERTASWLRPPRPTWMSKRDYSKVPKVLTMRLSDVSANRPSLRCEKFTIATTMLDINRSPSSWIGALYEGRWMIEPDIEAIKCTMGIEYLRSQTPEGIQRELWTGLFTYNLVRSKMLQAGRSANREARSLSFTETYQVLSTNWLLCACVGVSKPMVIASLSQCTCAVVGNRPGRAEPRENKRRPKTLKLMKVPRWIFHAAMASLSKIT
ncbi:IS4 family transposase [Neorhodopirellula lusitana]|uniref:IS4 family transposase n=1 Tax=Neorhodopirellula lusitana TaxID=445327 RepID=UPI00384AF4DF